MPRALVLASLLWPVVLGSAVWTRHHGRAPLWTAMVYAVGSRICHQRPERSFSTAGVSWPVCGRCSGLYLGAPIGAIWAWGLTRRRSSSGVRGPGVRKSESASLPTPDAGPRTSGRRPAQRIGVMSLPTVITIALEWTGAAPISTSARALAALPLGAAIAYALVRVYTSSSMPPASKPAGAAPAAGARPSPADRLAEPQNPVLTCAAAWLVPGAGQFLAGQHRKAVVFFCVLTAMFVIGLVLGGRLFPFQWAEPLVFLSALAQWTLGLPRLSALVGGFGQGDVVAATYEYGNTFLIVGGLLNALVILDAYDVATGRKAR